MRQPAETDAPGAEFVFGDCPLPLQDYDRVLLAHGNGGKLTHDLIARLFLPEFD